MRLFLKILLPVAVLLLIAWAAMARFRTEVPVAQAAVGPAIDAVTGTVKVFADLDVRIKAEGNGRLVEMAVEIGDIVKKGDLLCRLDSEELEMQLKQRRIQLKGAQERLQLPYRESLDIINIKEDIQRLKQQVEYGGASLAELERRSRDLERAEAALRYEEIQREESVNLLAAQVEALEAGIERMIIKAPFDGEVVEILKFPGDYIWAGNEVLRLVSEGRWIELMLAEEAFYGVTVGQKARMSLAGLPGQTIPARVTGMSSVADADRKTRAVFLDAEVSDEQLAPGFTGEALLVKAERSEATIVPRRALIGNRVYVVEDGRVDIREVKAGFLSLNKAEILEGVAPGELVILEGQSLLRKGDRVTPVPAE